MLSLLDFKFYFKFYLKNLQLYSFKSHATTFSPKDANGTVNGPTPHVPSNMKCFFVFKKCLAIFY